MNTDNHLNRRAFLKTTASATAGVIGFPFFVPSAALGKAGAVSPSNRITIGCIGVGDHGTGVNLKNFLANDDAHVLAVCDVDTKNRERARNLVNSRYGNNDCDAYNDFRGVLARSDIDAVMISTPDHWHVPMSIAAVKAGKDVCCEKPTLTIAEGRILSDTVRRYARVYQTSTEDRSVSVYHRMAELVRNGRIGKLHTIHVKLPGGHSVRSVPDKTHSPQPVPEGFDYDMWLGPAPWAPYTPGRIHWNWRWILDYSGGQLTDWGAHQVDTAQWGNDTESTGPIEIEGKGIFPSDGLYNTATHFHIVYKYANGVTLIIESNGRDIRFEGSQGWLGNTGWRGKLEASSEKILNSVIGPDELHLYTCAAGEHRNFLDCVKSRKDPYFPVETGHRCCSVMHLGNISMMLGKKLKWDPEKEIFPDEPEANKMLSRPMRSPWRLI